MKMGSPQLGDQSPPRPTSLAVTLHALNHWAPYLAAACGLAAGGAFAAASQVWQFPVARGLYIEFSVWMAFVAWMWVAASAITDQSRLWGEDYLRRPMSTSFRIAHWVILVFLLFGIGYYGSNLMGVTRGIMNCARGIEPEFCGLQSADKSFAPRLRRFIDTGKPD